MVNSIEIGRISDTYCRREQYLSGMLDWVNDVAEKVIDSNKRIIVWGCAEGGAYARYLFEKKLGNGCVEYLIDRSLYIPYHTEPKIYRPSLLRYIDNSKYILL